MKLTWKNPLTPYQALYPNAYMRFEQSVNNAVSKTRTFSFIIYPSEQHTNRPAIGQFRLVFTNNSHIISVFTDGVESFKLNNTVNGYVKISDDTVYTPVAQPTVVSFGFPSYGQIGYFIDELGEDIVFKNAFGVDWLMNQPFEGGLIGDNWEII